jgi:hypothetical protein
MTLREITQAALSILVVATTAIAMFIGRVFEGSNGAVLPPEWWAIVGLVIGFYFGRVANGNGNGNGK